MGNVGHPHTHVLITCGAFTPTGDFIELPPFDLERLLVAWQEQVNTLYLAQEKIEPEVVENMRTWQRSGFSVDQSVFLPAGDQAGIERLIQYMTRCPFSLDARCVSILPQSHRRHVVDETRVRAMEFLNRLLAHVLQTLGVFGFECKVCELVWVGL